MIPFDALTFALVLAGAAAPAGPAAPAASGTPAAPGACAGDSAHAVVAALYKAIDRHDWPAAAACFEDSESIIAVGPGLDAVTIGRKALAVRAARVLDLGAPLGAITRAKIAAGGASVPGGVFLDDIDVPGQPPLRVQIYVVHAVGPGAPYRVRLFHAAATLPDAEAAALGARGAFPLAAWPPFPRASGAPGPALALNRDWHTALARRELDGFMKLMARPDVLGAGSAPHERATTWDEYRSQIAPLLVDAAGGRKAAQEPVLGDTVGFASREGAVLWSLNAYAIGAVPLRATIVAVEDRSGLRIRSFFASVPRPAVAAPRSTP